MVLFRLLGFRFVFVAVKMSVEEMVSTKDGDASVLLKAFVLFMNVE